MEKLTAKTKHLRREFEYFTWKHPIPAHCLKCGIYLILCPCTCVYKCVTCCGATLLVCNRRDLAARKKEAKRNRIREVHFQHRQRSFKRRNSLSETPGFSLSRMVRNRERLCEQAQSPLFALLPTEIRLIIFGFVVSGEPVLHLQMSRAGKKDMRFMVTDYLPWVKQEKGCTPWTLDYKNCLRSYDQRSGCRSLSEVRPEIYENQSQIGRDKTQFMLLPLLKTCRRVYVSLLLTPLFTCRPSLTT
jgi:hypothetical protein